LGTLFIGEREKEGAGRTQLLLRTGSLQGKTFIWRQELAEGRNNDLSQSIMAAVKGESSGMIPMDVLQNKSTGSGFLRGDEQSAWESFKVWFAAGGINLYPLFAAGFLALFMIIERNIVFGLRTTNIDRYSAKVDLLIAQGKIKEAAAFCGKSRKSLAKVLHAILANASKPRSEAEKAVREVMLREIPALEKRLPLLAALGTAAPLLGLLGTVSGLVTLFKVLNQLGSNDPKVLAGGISEALVNTETGLAIAIPVLLVHGWLNERLDTLNAGLQSKGLELMNRLWPKD
jgi:biopolymer transport protein ExbB